MTMALIIWSNDRYELWIDRILKGYSQLDHEKGKDELTRMANEKGYSVHVEKRK